MDSTQWISWYYQSVNQYLTFYVGYLLVLVAASAVLWRRAKNQTARGMFWASLPSLILFAILAVTFITRNQEQMTTALAGYQQDAATLLGSELTVRQQGNQSFNTLAVLWPSLSILAALIVPFSGQRPVVTGVCVGLVAVFMGTFLLDFFAFRTTNDYLDHLHSAVAATR